MAQMLAYARKHGMVERYSCSDEQKIKDALRNAGILIDQVKKQMRSFDEHVNERDVKQVLEEDKNKVTTITKFFSAFLNACNGIDCNEHFSKVLELFEEHRIIVFKGPKFDGLELKSGNLVIKVHLFPPDSEETLWHNHGQNFFTSVIGKAGQYWHRHGELHDDCKGKKVHLFGKQEEGDPALLGEMSGCIRPTLAHTHKSGCMYFIDAEAKHTVQAEQGTGSILTCVVQGVTKTNATRIFKDDDSAIESNFCPRDKSLPKTEQIATVKAIMDEIAEVDVMLPLVEAQRLLMFQENVIGKNLELSGKELECEYEKFEARRCEREIAENFCHEMAQVIKLDRNINTRDALAVTSEAFKGMVSFFKFVALHDAAVTDGKFEVKPVAFKLCQCTQRDGVPTLSLLKKKDDACSAVGGIKWSVVGEKLVEFVEKLADLPDSPVFLSSISEYGGKHGVRVCSSSRAVPGLFPGKMIKLKSFAFPFAELHDLDAEKKTFKELLNMASAMKLWCKGGANHWLRKVEQLMTELEYSNVDAVLVHLRNEKHTITHSQLLNSLDLEQLLGDDCVQLHKRALVSLSEFLDYLQQEQLCNLREGEHSELELSFNKDTGSWECKGYLPPVPSFPLPAGWATGS